jgi:hypothetical protein
VSITKWSSQNGLHILAEVNYNCTRWYTNHCLRRLPRQQKAASFGRDVAPLGRKVGYHGLCQWGSTDKVIGTDYLKKEVCYEKNSTFVFVLSDDRVSFLW